MTVNARRSTRKDPESAWSLVGKAKAGKRLGQAGAEDNGDNGDCVTRGGGGGGPHTASRATLRSFTFIFPSRGKPTEGFNEQGMVARSGWQHGKATLIVCGECVKGDESTFRRRWSPPELIGASIRSGVVKMESSEQVSEMFWVE